MTREERRLAAIVSADVVGYSRLMGVDETGTVQALRAHRADLIDAKVAEHGGRIVKTMGDGLLLEFPSVVEAVRCSIAVQEGMAARNEDVAEAERIIFRIGVNLGDIIVDGDDILGDGVNVAARLQEIAAPGGISVSGRVYEDIRDRLNASFADAGPQALKNIARPVHVWSWPGAGAASVAPTQSDPLPLPDKPSIAVLPFDNMSGDPEQEFLADGMTEDIITELSRMPWFFVIARNSSFTYKGAAVDIKQVATDLGVKYVLEGSVRKAGNRLRITAQLVDATSGNHVWAERYDREMADIFDIQDEVTEAIVSAVAPEFLSVEEKRARRKDPSQLDAWEYVMRGRAHLWKLSRNDVIEARKYFERAIELVPSGEYGTGDLALVHYLEAYYRWSDDPAKSFTEMLKAAEAGVAADDHDVWALIILAWSNAVAGQFDEVMPPVERAIELSPNFAPAIGFHGALLCLTGETGRGIERIHEAIRLSPRDSISVFWRMGEFWGYYAEARYEEAAEAAQRGIRLAPQNPTFRRQLAAAYAMQDRMDEATAALVEFQRLEPHHTLADAAKVPCSVPEHLERFVEGLRRAGLPEA